MNRGHMTKFGSRLASRHPFPLQTLVQPLSLSFVPQSLECPKKLTCFLLNVSSLKRKIHLPILHFVRASLVSCWGEAPGYHLPKIPYLWKSTIPKKSWENNQEVAMLTRKGFFSMPPKPLKTRCVPSLFWVIPCETSAILTQTGVYYYMKKKYT